MRSTGAGARAASRACDSEPRSPAGELPAGGLPAGELPAGELPAGRAAGDPCAGDAAARRGLSPLELRAERGTGGSAWTAVGAELFEPASDAGWGCEPPGFIAAESSRAAVPVEAYRAEIEHLRLAAEAGMLVRVRRSSRPQRSSGAKWITRERRFCFSRASACWRAGLRPRLVSGCLGCIPRRSFPSRRSPECWSRCGWRARAFLASRPGPRGSLRCSSS